MDGSVPHLIASQPVGGRDPESIAPELWAQQDFDGYAVDLWSVGIVLWKMVVPTAKVQLFAAPVLDDFRYRDYCVEGKLQERLQVASGLPADVVDLLTGLLRANPVERFTLGQVLDHPWLAE
jgi:serine/threonine protein kinase